MTILTGLLQTPYTSTDAQNFLHYLRQSTVLITANTVLFHSTVLITANTVLFHSTVLITANNSIIPQYSSQHGQKDHQGQVITDQKTFDTSTS